MANISSKTEARKKVHEAQARTNEAWMEPERHNVDDAASVLVELGRLAAVDQWEQGRAVEIRAEAERRRHEHRQASAAAASRMLERGETLTAFAELAGVKVSEVRAVLNQHAHKRARRHELRGAERAPRRGERDGRGARRRDQPDRASVLRWMSETSRCTTHFILGIDCERNRSSTVVSPGGTPHAAGVGL